MTSVPPVSSSVTSSAAAGVPVGGTVVGLRVVGEDRVEKISGIAKAMVKAMTHAQQVPHFGYDDEVTFNCRQFYF